MQRTENRERMNRKIRSFVSCYWLLFIMLFIINNTMEHVSTIILPYSATAISILARFIFMYLLWTKRSVNSLSLTFCLMNIASSGMWLKYSLEVGESPLILRSSVDIVLFFVSAGYIVRNKWMETYQSQDRAVMVPDIYMLEIL